MWPHCSGTLTRKGEGEGEGGREREYCLVYFTRLTPESWSSTAATHPEKVVVSEVRAAMPCLNIAFEGLKVVVFLAQI